VRRLIHCSSVDAIGLPEGDAPSTEETPWNWDRLGVDNPYARTKFVSQQRALAAAAADLDVVVVNPTYMLGAYDVRPSSGQMILESAAGKAIGFTRGGNNFVHVEDVADAMLAAAERGRRGELYILGNANMSYREIFTLIAEVVGASPPRFGVPYPLARLGGWGGDLLAWVSGKEPTLNTITTKMGYVDHYYSPRKAVEELGMKQTPVRAAVERAVEWFRQSGKLPGEATA
jgi:dihydroflavonol-4-reductase